jgi:hypothetical protein
MQGPQSNDRYTVLQQAGEKAARAWKLCGLSRAFDARLHGDICGRRQASKLPQAADR